MPEDIKISVQLIDNITNELKALNTKMDNFHKKSAEGAKKSEAAMTSLTNSATNLIKAYLGFAGIRVAWNVMKDLTAAYGKQEEAEYRLTAALKQKGIFTQQELERSKRFASEMQQLTKYGDEQILAVQRLVIQYGIWGTQNDKVIKASADLASGLGMDLQSATELVTKTINSSMNAMSRYGISVTGAVGSVERLDSVIGGIQSKFAGSAQAEAETYTGKVTQMKNAFGDLEEVLGSKLVPAFTSLAEASTTFFKLFISDIATEGTQDFAEQQLKIAENSLKWVEEKKKSLKEGSFFEALFGTEEIYDKQIANYKKTISKMKADITAFKEETKAEGGILKKEGQIDPEEEKRLNDIQQMKEDLAYKEIELNNTLNEKLKQSSEERWKTDRELAIAAYIERQNLINEEQTKLEEFASNRKQTEEEYQTWMKQQRVAALEDTIGNALALTSLFKDNSREMFAMTKALSIAQATMNTYKGATAALDYPPPLSFIAAASQIAFGFAQVAQIASTPFKAALGADFITNGRQLMMVGDNPGGQERVQVTPLSSPNVNGTKTTNTTRIIPVVVIRGGNIVKELERASISNEIDWERILPREVINAR